MRQTERKIAEKPPDIRQLDQNAQNRIAAGEVVERPAAALKELVENAIDAGATKITVTIADGGKSLIRVEDNGHGIPADQMPLALSRHATSKFDGSDLVNIASFGFRGEALPSLGAVGRLSLSSRNLAAPSGAKIEVSGGEIGDVTPTPMNQGTIVELRDIFFATPARLKFLRSDRAETQAITDSFKRLAMAEPTISFDLQDISGSTSKRLAHYDGTQGELFETLQNRLRQILGSSFIENALPIDVSKEDARLRGYVSLPTFHRGNAQHQFLFVNGRPVKDKLLIGALRAAYMDVLHGGRYPVVALFLDLPFSAVDVNVHPAKSEVRFRDASHIRGLIISAIRHTLAEGAGRSSNTVADAALSAFQAEPQQARIYQMDHRAQPTRPTSQLGFAETQQAFSARVEPEEVPQSDGPLGAARAQVHENYIIAQTSDGMVIVDQHAAHERLVYEQLKALHAKNAITRQALLIPEVIELSEGDCALLLEHADALGALGLVIEGFGTGAIAVQEIPAVLGEVDAKALIMDMLDELSEHKTTTELQSRIDAILSRVACHGSIRSGRQIRAEEMNALLRQMEATPLSGQCNHGRPTYVELKLKDIEKLFGRR
ncbi:MAG: DNA mismatch repair endonuclease MutL [Pseudomonadota bacterium]